MVTFLAEPGLELWATDVGNAFLESYTSERVLFKAGPEFGDREGHTLVIVRAQYVAVEHVGTTNWPTSSEIWVSSPHYLRRTFDERKEITTNTWRYTWMTSPSLARIQAIIDELTTTHKFKGTGPITYHPELRLFSRCRWYIVYCPSSIH
jgi:hypothetical protein